MSAPSKEEIAALVRVVAFQCGSGEAAQVADLADENERLRAELSRPMPWTEDELKALIKEAVESDPNGKCLHCGGTFPKTDLYHWRDCLRHTANIEIAKLRADLAAMTASFDEAAGHLTRLMDERAECLALLEDAGGYQSLDYCDDDPDDIGETCADVYDENTKPCWSHRLAAMIAKLRSAP